MQKTVLEIASGVSKKDFSAESVVSQSMAQIEKINSRVNAIVEVNTRAIEAARNLDQKIASGAKAGPLAGVPIAIKDLLCTKGIRTTAGSKILHNFVPPYSATVVDRLEAAGAIVVGKANLDEFAMGSSNENSYFGAVRNPWNMDYVPGGSSGGSAAAVAGLMAPAAIGTDTGGSIRQPANFCGLVGVKPTYGRVSRYGIIAFASSLDQAGPMTKTVKESAKIMEVICGKDTMDATSSSEPVPEWTKNIQSNLKGLKVGLPKEYFSGKLNPDTKKVVDSAIEAVKDAGASIVEVSLPLTGLAVPIYYLIATSEASSNLARYDGVRFGYRADFSKVPAKDLADFYCRNRGEAFGSEVKRRIVLGTYCLSSGYYEAYYGKACQVRRLLRDQFLDAFKSCDVMLSPVTASPAFKIGERVDDPLQMYLNDIFTTAIPLAGLPGMSVPAGFSTEGLPIGVQLSSAHFKEQVMFNVGQAIEDRMNVWKRCPDGI